MKSSGDKILDLTIGMVIDMKIRALVMRTGTFVLWSKEQRYCISSQRCIHHFRRFETQNLFKWWAYSRERITSYKVQIEAFSYSQQTDVTNMITGTSVTSSKFPRSMYSLRLFKPTSCYGIELAALLAYHFYITFQLHNVQHALRILFRLRLRFQNLHSAQSEP